MKAATGLKSAGVAAAVLAVAVAGLTRLGAARWAASTRALTKRLDVARRPVSPQHYAEQQIGGLPAPVQRYFQAVLTPGQPMVAATTVEQTGRFNTAPAGERWKPFRARQWVVSRRPGFVWDARIELLPGLAVRVHDAYIAGEGSLRAAALGLLTVARAAGGGTLAAGELMRFLAEAAWYPTVLLPGQGVRWTAVDDRSATATLDDDGLSVTLLFRFNATHLIDSVHAAARGMTVGDTVVMTPWEGRWSDYRLRNGLLVPLHGEAAWLPTAGRHPYWRGTIGRVDHELVA